MCHWIYAHAHIPHMHAISKKGALKLSLSVGGGRRLGRQGIIWEHEGRGVQRIGGEAGGGRRQGQEGGGEGGEGFPKSFGGRCQASAYHPGGGGACALGCLLEFGPGSARPRLRAWWGARAQPENCLPGGGRKCSPAPGGYNSPKKKPG